MTDSNPLWRKLWGALVLLAGALELRGIRDPSKDDTLTEYTRSKIHHPVVRAGIGALVGWLPYHFFLGEGVPLGLPDLASAVSGAALGVLSLRVVKGRQAGE